MDSVDNRPATDQEEHVTDYPRRTEAHRRMIRHRRRQRAWRTASAVALLVTAWALAMLWLAAGAADPVTGGTVADADLVHAWGGTVVAAAAAMVASLYLEDRNRLLADDLEAGR